MGFSYLKNAEYRAPFKINCEFEDGKSGTLDLRPYIKPSGIFNRLAEESFAKNFEIDGGVLTWGDKAIDIAPETVYHQVTGLPLPAWMEK